MSGVLKETAFTKERQEAEFEFATVPLSVSILLFGGEYPLADTARDVKGLVDQMSSRNEHCFAGQRTGLESPHIGLEYLHDAVYYFLGETHASPVDSGHDRIKVDGFGGKERFTPSAESVTWGYQLRFEIWTSS